MGNNNITNKERREFKRLKVNITIVYRVNKPSHIRVLIGEEEVEAVTLDLSQGGMSILTKYDIPVFAVLSIEFMIYNIDEFNKFRFYKSIKVIGEVRSNIPGENNDYRIGIVFTKIDPEDKLEIANFVRKRIASGNTEMFPDGAG